MFCGALDLQKVLTVPHTNASSLYYSRKLCTYNLTVADMVKGSASNYIWDGTNGKRGSCEISTCLYKYVLSISLHITEFIFCSDTCGGQNRNQFASIMFCHLVKTIPKIKIIDHKFLEKGHSYNRCDNVHGTIETNSRHVQVFIPHEWHNIIITQ